MIRTSAPTWQAFGMVALVATAAAAEPTSTSTTTTTGTEAPAQTGRRIAVETPTSAFVPHAQISPTLYLERCKGGCEVKKGGLNDARTMTSTIPNNCAATGCPVAEYVNAGGMTGTAADAEWNAVVQCVKEVYSPFNVTVTDVKPAAGVSHHVAILAGVPGDIGLGNDILGIAPLAGDCSPQDNVISFSFANAHGTGSDRIHNLCWTAAQESAHAFGLDHEYAFQDGRSACNDPMTYRTDCGGQRFFRNDVASCGEFEPRPCRCGANQNSHLKIQSVFGAGTAITGNPTSNVSLPLPNTALGAVISAQAGSKRGVAKVELLLNGFKWAEAKGALFGSNGQPNPSNYTITVPGNVPNSKIKVVVRAYDDLGAYTDSAPIESFKGTPTGCADETGCAKGQRCDAGYCMWDQPSGEIGADCTYPQFCLSGICQGTADQQICTQECIPGVGDSCPDGLGCVEASPGKGVCFFSEEEGGCCSVGEDGETPWLHAGVSLGLLGLIVLRPRRRRR